MILKRKRTVSALKLKQTMLYKLLSIRLALQGFLQYNDKSAFPGETKNLQCQANPLTFFMPSVNRISAGMI